MKLRLRKLLSKQNLLRLLVATACLILPAFLPTSPGVLIPPASKDPSLIDIHVLSHGWHTGVIVKREDLAAQVPALTERFGDYEFLEVGWGDAGFYQAQKITTGITLRAIFLPTSSVVHIVGFDGPPSIYFKHSEQVRIPLPNDHYAVLLKFLKSSFATGAYGQPIKLSPGIYGDSQFYKGGGKYYAYNTCNKWTAKALSSGGLPMNHHLKLTSEDVMNFLKNYARRSRD